MNYLDEIKLKKQAQAASNERRSDKLSTKQDIDAVIAQLKEVQLASLMGNKQKPSIVLTDSTDLGEHISGLGDKIIEVLEAVKDDKSTTQQINHLSAMVTDFKSLITGVQQSNKAQADRIVTAVNSLKEVIAEQKPVVVPAPNVRLTEKATDFTPLINELKTILTPKAVKKQINLADYRAIDLDNAPGNVQYVGFQNSAGNWYILQNNEETNSIRYYFGKDGYDVGWDERHGHDYKTLSEAMR